jgi:predicted metalloprotease
MRWQGRRQSTNVEDRRGMRTGPLAIGGGSVGVIIVLVVLLVKFLGGGDLTGVIDQVSTLPTDTGTLDGQRAFVSVVLADTEEYWGKQFESSGKTYRAPKLILFSGQVQTASGVATSATGPFYSPADQMIYIDLSFYQELQDRFGAGGDAAQAYVIAHEVGHAVQDQLGVLDEVYTQEQSAGDKVKSELSVRTELQADFYAGLVARYQGANKWLEAGDVEEALNAANAIGDDRLQQQAQGYVVPDSFTHGTSVQRVRWFKLGYETGDMSRGDTFSIPYGAL